MRTTSPPPADNHAVCLELISELGKLRDAMLEREAQSSALLAGVSGDYAFSARNLIHYLALRSTDLRQIQQKLSWLGLSSLGHAESHVLANLNKVLGLLHRLTGQDWCDRSAEEPTGSIRSQHLLDQHVQQLLGPVPEHRPVRIMVTLPSEAAHDFGRVRELVEAGMDVARINCAHDDPKAWKAMAAHVRRAAKMANREVRILMDLGGPKIRTGDVAPRPAALKLRPHRDEYGRAFHPARLALCANDAEPPQEVMDNFVGVDARWLNRLEVGSQIDFTDARGAKRHLLVVQIETDYAVAEMLQTAYLTPDTTFTLHSHNEKKRHATSLSHIEPLPGLLHLYRGDLLRVTKDGIGQSAQMYDDSDDDEVDPAHIACTLPQVIDQVREGEPIWFDDGKIGGLVRKTTAEWLEVEITQARDCGEKLGADKGINLPDSALDLPALTSKDIDDLATVAEVADMVGLSFVQQPEDVFNLRKRLHAMGGDHLGIVLKIETIRGFEHLPELMLAAMGGSAAGVMIARGDLAVECGFERMAEVQEEILWCAESAHMPVIWATQVLETLAKTGTPSRAEISDAALGVRAECVMLNKGPYITDAIRALDDILRRMGAHQAKKKPLLRALRAWAGEGKPAASMSPTPP